MNDYDYQNNIESQNEIPINDEKNTYQGQDLSYGQNYSNLQPIQATDEIIQEPTSNYQNYDISNANIENQNSIKYDEYPFEQYEYNYPNQNQIDNYEQTNSNNYINDMPLQSTTNEIEEINNNELDLNENNNQENFNYNYELQKTSYIQNDVPYISTEITGLDNKTEIINTNNNNNLTIGPDFNSDYNKKTYSNKNDSLEDINILKKEIENNRKTIEDKNNQIL